MSIYIVIYLCSKLFISVYLQGGSGEKGLQGQSGVSGTNVSISVVQSAIIVYTYLLYIP